MLGRPTISLEERFWNNVDKISSPTGCWLWNGFKNNQGYGCLGYKGRRNMLAHRVVWIITHGFIPDGLCVLHRCDNPSCVNPDHLYVGTKADNYRDMVIRGRLGDRRCFGEKHGNHKLTNEIVKTIREVYTKGLVSQYRLAKQYGVSLATIQDVTHYRSWKGV